MLKVLTWASEPGPKGLCCSQTLSKHLGSSMGLQLLLSVNTAASAGASAPQYLPILQRASTLTISCFCPCKTFSPNMPQFAEL